MLLVCCCSHALRTKSASRARKRPVGTEYQMMKVNTKLLLVLASAAVGLVGCADYYASSPGYGYYGGPYYGGYPGSVTVAVGDRPYYVNGPGYYRGRTYYVWKQGHWSTRHGQRVWIHGHYVVRG